MEKTSAGGHWHSRRKPVLVFLLHQIIAVIGVPVAAPWAYVLCIGVLGLFGRTIYMTHFHRILTETPYFPVQILFGLFLGWFLGVYLRHRSMLWVWVLPFAVMCFVFAAFPFIGQLALSHYADLSSSSRLSHFFGWGCQPKNHCLDQLMITLPFYSAVAYSLGGLLARRTSHARNFVESMRAINKARAIVFIGVPCFGLIFASGWRSFAQTESLRTGFGILLYLGGVLLESVFLAFLLVVVTGFVGRRSFLRRLFINASQ